MTGSLTLAAYQSAAQRTDQRRQRDSSLSFPLLGLFGETGSLLSELKKKQRDPVAYLGYADSVLEELGDVLWYYVAIADRAGLTLADLAVNLDADLASWQASGTTALTFAGFEKAASPRTNGPSPAFEKALLRLAGEVGLLMTDHRAGCGSAWNIDPLSLGIGVQN